MDRFRYFLRSVPADDKQARAVVSYLKKFQFNNIQVIVLPAVTQNMQHFVLAQ